MTRLVGLDFACNDPDGGAFAGRCGGIQLYIDGEPFFELEPRSERAPRMGRRSDGVITIAGRRWRTAGWQEWAGNWCWDRFDMPVLVAAEFLIWLHGTRLFVLTCGDSRLYSLWRSRTSLSACSQFLVDKLETASR